MAAKQEQLTRKRMRYALGIGLEEYNKVNIAAVRDFQAELLMSVGYIGYADIWCGTLRMFVFDTEPEMKRLHEEAKKLGFRTAGMIDGIVSVSNMDLKRPHLERIESKSAFYRELYR